MTKQHKVMWQKCSEIDGYISPCKCLPLTVNVARVESDMGKVVF